MNTISDTSNTFAEFNTFALPVMIVDGAAADLPILFANDAWWNAHRALDRHKSNHTLCLVELYQTSPQDRLSTTVNDVISNPLNYRTITAESIHRTHAQGRWYRHALSCLRKKDHSLTEKAVLIIEQDITWEVLNESRLSQKAALDPLTGLLAREPFLEELRRQLDRLAESNDGLCLVFIDLNDFKPINDQYGHDVGDQVLSQFGERLIHEMSHEVHAGRLGGDEFVLLLSGTYNPETVKAYLNQLAERVLRPLDIGPDFKLSIGASFGFACTQDTNISAKELLKAADQSMYQAKNNRTDKPQAVGGVVESRTQRQNRAELVKALATEGLEMYIQPVISLKHGQTIGFEVLPRWNHPSHGLLDLEHFNPLLIQSEEGKAFDRWLILSAAKLSAQFQNQGFDIGIGINLTRRQLDDGTFVDIMREAIPYFSDGRVDLTLEIIESPQFRDHHLAFSALQQARELGGQVVLDHFGGATSSMTFAAKVPLDFIKLHHDLSHGLVNAPDRQRHVGAVIAFAHHLGLPVVASGIGDETDAEILKNLNCDLIQGNVWLEAMTVEQAITYFNSNTTGNKFPLRRKR